MNRREFLWTGGAALSLPVLGANPAGAFQSSAGPGDAALNLLFEKIFQEQMKTSPLFATYNGLDKGELADLRSKLDTRPIAEGRREDVSRTDKFIALLEAVPEAGLSQSAALNREVVLWGMRTQNVGPKRFDIANPQSPYEVSQLTGNYFYTPDSLNSVHTIDNAADADAYLSRLEQFATVLDNETAETRRQAARGYLAPAWALDLAMKQMQALRASAPEQSSLAESVARRAAAKNVAGDWRGRAGKIVADKIYPALDRAVASLLALRPSAAAGDGVWRVPDGDAVYTAALAEATTTSYTADEIHELGLQQVAEISTELDRILKAAGLSSGTVGERLTALNTRDDQLYPDNDAGRDQLLADVNEGVKAMYAKLPQAFATLPKQPLEMGRVPPEIQDGAPNGYYRLATFDGSRPAVYSINLKSTADWPKYSLPALTYHEGVPGHHLQLSIAQLAGDLPMLRRTTYYQAYGEGWGLYAEQLADELGGFKDLERAGYLQSFLFRAERLVVDTGLHHKRWTREQAIEHMVAATGFARPRVQREIERYCALPGQACSYKIGHTAWLRARTKAQQALGPQFDLRDFHEILLEGAMPLTIFERRVDERIKARLAGAGAPNGG